MRGPVVIVGKFDHVFKNVLGLCRWRHQGAVKKQLCGGHCLGLREEVKENGDNTIHEADATPAELTSIFYKGDSLLSQLHAGYLAHLCPDLLVQLAVRFREHERSGDRIEMQPKTLGAVGFGAGAVHREELLAAHLAHNSQNRRMNAHLVVHGVAAGGQTLLACVSAQRPQRKDFSLHAQ
eukprot:1180211-Prorocentrum_minimum.AAC.3